VLLTPKSGDIVITSVDQMCLFVVYLTTLFKYLRLYRVDVGGKPAAFAQFLLNPDSPAKAI
jgi:hypothetical protein